MNFNDYFERANTFSMKKDYDSAIADLTEAIELKPDSVSLLALAYFSRAMAYLNKKDNIRAIIDYTEAIQLGLDNAIVATAYYNRGVAYQREGAFYYAMSNFGEASSLNPNDKDSYEAKETASRLYNRGGERAQKGVEARIDREIAKTKHEIEEAKLKRAREAEEAKLKQDITKYTEELRTNPNSASAYYNRGVVYEKQCQYDQAFNDFEKAVNLEPANKNYREAFEKEREREEKEQHERREAEKRKEQWAKEHERRKPMHRIGFILLLCLSVTYLFILWGTDIVRAPWIASEFIRVLPLAGFSLAVGAISIVFLKYSGSFSDVLILVGIILVQSITASVWLGNVGFLFIFLIGRILINTLVVIPGAILVFFGHSKDS